MVVRVCNPSIQKAKAGRSRIGRQSASTTQVPGRQAWAMSQVLDLGVQNKGTKGRNGAKISPQLTRLFINTTRGIDLPLEMEGCAKGRRLVRVGEELQRINADQNILEKFTTSFWNCCPGYLENCLESFLREIQMRLTGNS